jgi:hypothetical protein
MSRGSFSPRGGGGGLFSAFSPFHQNPPACSAFLGQAECAVGAPTMVLSETLAQDQALQFCWVMPRRNRVAGQAGWKPNPPNRALMTFWESWRINKPAPILPRDFQRRLGNPPAFAEGPGRSSASANRVAEQRSSGSSFQDAGSSLLRSTTKAGRYLLNRQPTR